MENNGWRNGMENKTHPQISSNVATYACKCVNRQLFAI